MDSIQEEMKHASGLLGGSNLIDCTQLITPETFSFVGCFFEGCKYNPSIIYEGRDQKGGYAKEKITIALDVGTHIDSPCHFFKGLRAIEALQLSELVAPGMVIDVMDKCAKDPVYQLTVQDLQDWEKRNGPIPERPLVVMKTGWYLKFNNTTEYLGLEKEFTGKVEGSMKFPGFSLEAAEWLLKHDKKPVGIGIDTGSLDVSTDHMFKVHQAWLGAGRYQVENMRLEGVPEKGVKFILLPLRIQGAMECCARIMAVVS